MINFEDLFVQARAHVAEHNCSAHPYQSYNKLVNYCRKYKPQNILEIGTGTGFITTLLLQTCPEAEIISIEKNEEHWKSSQKFISKYTENSNYTILFEVAEEVLGDLPEDSFDFIFFDGFQIHYEFLPHYQRLLKHGGILFCGNNHLTSRTSDQFFEELNNSPTWEVIEKFEETTVAIKK